jgi:SAM-dependent methyltransferase
VFGGAIAGSISSSFGLRNFVSSSRPCPSGVRIITMSTWTLSSPAFKNSKSFALCLSKQSKVELGCPLMLRTPAGKRFEELGSLVEGYLLDQMSRYPEVGREMAFQLLNVLKNCDTITYNEPGTGNAYALLHFLDRYHRFQLTFDLLAHHRLMPLKQRDIDVLDIGTGPGPSMFALSDFYCERFGYVDLSRVHRERPHFRIDYVERSIEFRHWLHGFTEYANSYAPTGRYWYVPYHHGTFGDFSAIEFDEEMTSSDQDEDGYYHPTSYIRRHRFDLVIVSNFLTTRPQVLHFQKELRDCARFLRHNGILLVVGATATSEKYKHIYDTISEIILGQGYGSRKFIAWCERVNLEPHVLSYRWGDPYGEQLKKHIGAVYRVLQAKHPEIVPDEAARILSASVEPDYNRTNAWQILVFRKNARPRPQNRRPQRKNVKTRVSLVSSGLPVVHPS